VTQSKSAIQLNQILQEDADWVLNWLTTVELEPSSAPEEFNWLGLAEAAGFDALEDDRHHPNISIKWAEIALKVYNKLAESTNVDTRDSLLNSSMMLRAAMIVKFGAIPDHPVLDVNSILHWFKDSLKMSYSEAESKAANWKKCKIEEIRELRKIKNRLKAISVLANSGKVVLAPEINLWLSLQKQLP
jgi:pterin-4a-carbinolamine dehydratase